MVNLILAVVQWCHLFSDSIKLFTIPLLLSHDDRSYPNDNDDFCSFRPKASHWQSFEEAPTIQTHARRSSSFNSEILVLDERPTDYIGQSNLVVPVADPSCEWSAPMEPPRILLKASFSPSLLYTSAPPLPPINTFHLSPCPPSPHPRRQLRIVKPRLRVMRWRLAMRAAHLARYRRPASEVCAAVAAVEDDVHEPRGGGGGARDGEVGFWREVLGIEWG